MRVRVRPVLRTGLQFILAIGTLLLSPSLPANTTPPTSRPMAPAAPVPLLEHDPRLKRDITLHETNITLKALLLKLSTDGLILTVDEICGAQKLQLSLHHKSLLTLMTSLSELMPGHWEALPDHHGYLFLMSQKAVVRRQRWWDLYNEERKRAREAQRQKMLMSMRTPPPPSRGYDAHGNELPQEEARMSRYQQLFRDLPAELQERIANQMVGFTIELGSLGTYGLEEGAVTLPATDLSASFQTALQQSCSEFLDKNQATLNDLIVRFNNLGNTVTVCAVLPAESSGEERTWLTPIELHVDTAPDAAILPLNLRRFDRILKRLGNSAPPAWRELAAYQDSRFWPNDPPRLHNDAIPKALAGSLPHAPPAALQADLTANSCRSDFLKRLATQGGMDFVSDYYSASESPQEPQEVTRPLRYDLKEELNELAKSHDVSWSRTVGDIYLIRNNRWYRDDALEIPTPLLQRWWQKLVALQHLSGPSARTPRDLFQVRSSDRDPSHLKAQLDWEADVASHLTDLQIATSFSHSLFEQAIPASSVEMPQSLTNETVVYETVMPFVVVGNQMLGELNTVHFYAGLDTTQRELLLAGRLPISSLQPAQQDQLLFLLPSLRQLAGPQEIWIRLRFRSFPPFWSGEQGAEMPDRPIYLESVPAH